MTPLVPHREPRVPKKPWTLQEHLDELERTDPEVRAAREKLDRAIADFVSGRSARRELRLRLMKERRKLWRTRRA